MDVQVTPSAEKFIKRLLRFDGGPAAGSGSGDAPAAAPASPRSSASKQRRKQAIRSFEVNGIKLFLPAESRLLLDGVTIDFAESPTQSGFVFHDPKKKAAAAVRLA